jgi:hypothetical protein
MQLVYLYMGFFPSMSTKLTQLHAMLALISIIDNDGGSPAFLPI